MFGPAYATIVSIGSTAINSLISAVASIVGNLSPPAAAALHQRLRGSSPTQAVVIGVTPQKRDDPRLQVMPIFCYGRKPAVRTKRTFRTSLLMAQALEPFGRPANG